MADGNIRVGVHTISWGLDRNFKDLEGVLDEAQTTGVEGVEVGSRVVDLDHPREFAKRLSDRGLQLAACMQRLYLYDDARIPTHAEDVKRAAHFAAAAGARYVTTATIRKESGDIDEADRATAARALQAAGEAARAEGCMLLYHNYALPVANGEVDYYHANVDSDVLGFAVDIGWFSKAGGDFAEFYDRDPNRIRHVHLKDYKDFQVCTVGAGEVGYRDVLDMMLRRNFDGWAAIELERVPGTKESWDAHDEDLTHTEFIGPTEGVRESVRWVKATLAELALAEAESTGGVA